MVQSAIGKRVTVLDFPDGRSIQLGSRLKFEACVRIGWNHRLPAVDP